MSDLDRFQYGYDLDSNRQYKANVVGTGVVTTGLDEYYAYDALSRLTKMQRGVLTGGPPPTGISGTPVREMDYGLDITGNWGTYQTLTSGTTDLNQTRTSNTVNEITAIGGTPGWATPPEYDPAGNLLLCPEPGSPTSSYVAQYDAWNRMVGINGGSVAAYSYDGRHRRISAVLSSSYSEERYYTDDWQCIEERSTGSSVANVQYVWGIRYVDELVCQFSSGTRLYAAQDANFNVTAMITSAGVVNQRYVYDPYGAFQILNGSWSSGSYTPDGFYQHQGGRYEPATGLYNFRNRDYHPLLGAWMQRDPIGYGDLMNLYQYCRANPTKLRDALGYASQVPPDWQPGDQIPYHNPNLPVDPTDPEDDAAFAALEAAAERLWWLQIEAAIAAGVGVGCGLLLNKYTPIDNWLGFLLSNFFMDPNDVMMRNAPPGSNPGPGTIGYDDNGNVILYGGGP